MSREQPTGRIDITAHSRVVCIGDVHGDIWPFLAVMKRAGLISVPEDVMVAATTCHAAKTEKERTGYPITKAQANSIQWIGGSSCAIFTGDVLDNRRGSKQDPFGVCAKTGTQQMILYLLGELNRRARRSDGRLVLVLGNHDVANYVFDAGNHMCKRYAPLRSYNEADERNYDTCSITGAFRREHTERMRAKMAKLRPVALMRIVGSSDDSVLVMHGGLCHLDFLSSADVPSKYRIVEGEKPQVNVDRINGIFWDAVFRRPEAVAMITEHAEKLPIWCRPTAIGSDKGEELRAYFGTSKMIKAHDVQDSANCNVGGRDTSGAAAARMEQDELCRIDVAMGRAFGRNGMFAFCELTDDGEGIVRRVEQWHPSEE